MQGRESPHKAETNGGDRRSMLRDLEKVGSVLGGGGGGFCWFGVVDLFV